MQYLNNVMMRYHDNPCKNYFHGYLNYNYMYTAYGYGLSFVTS